MKGCLLFLILCTAPLSTYAQASLEGAWALNMTMPEGHENMHLDVTAKSEQDSLRLHDITDRGSLSLENVAYEEEVLRFEIPTGHGTIQCTLYQEAEETFSGFCAGPMGESPTSLKRPGSDPHHGGHR